MLQMSSYRARTLEEMYYRKLQDYKVKIENGKVYLNSASINL